MTESSSLEPSIALAAYAEPLASNRRVLVFGNALASLSVQLLERGARSVHVCDADPVRVAEATARNRSSQISFSTIADSDLSVQDGAFELAVVENLGAFGPMGLVRKAKHALAPRGVAVIACPNPEAAFPLIRPSNPAATTLDYYALYDSVAAEFEHVRMLGQTPFVGYAIADFSASGEPEPALDTSFVPGGAEEPDLFIALCSEHEVRLDEFAVVQLPTRRLLGGLSAPAESVAPSKAQDAELSRLNQWIKELESRASTADERADHADTELDELRPKLEAEQLAFAALKARHEKELGSLKSELEHKASEISSSALIVAERDRLLAEQSAQLTAQSAQLAAHSAELAAHSARLLKHAELEQEGSPELAAFEAQLVLRGAEVRKLEQDLRTAERTGRELVHELTRRRADQATAAGGELELALAEREADLQAAAWTIESLTLRLELAGKPLPRDGNDGAGPETARSIDEAR